MSHMTLDSQFAGALIPGRNSHAAQALDAAGQEVDFMDKSPARKVRVLRSFWMNEQVQEKGKIITVSAGFARELISMNKAEEVEESLTANLGADKIKKGGAEK